MASDVEREYLPDEGEIDDFAFSVGNMVTGEVMKIYPDGQIDGFPPGFSVVINKIPGLIARASGLGYSEALSRIADARRRLFESMVGEFRKGEDGKS